MDPGHCSINSLTFNFLTSSDNTANFCYSDIIRLLVPQRIKNLKIASYLLTNLGDTDVIVISL
jgi:hypothetical protein